MQISNHIIYYHIISVSTVAYDIHIVYRVGSDESEQALLH